MKFCNDPSIKSTLLANKYVVSLKIKNNNRDDVTINFGLKYGFDNGENLILDDEANWLMEYQEIVLLSEVPVGSYVKYVGNNLNDGSNVQNNYCYNEKNTYIDKGWKIAYIDKGYPHLITAGASECIGADKEQDIISYVDNAVLNKPLSSSKFSPICFFLCISIFSVNATTNFLVSSLTFLNLLS